MKNLEIETLCWCNSKELYRECHMEQDNIMNLLRQKGEIVPHKGLIRTQEEIEGIRRSGEITKRILEMVESRIKEGVTTNTIDKWVYDMTLEHNAIPAPLNYEGFPKSLCTSINEVICHGIPDDKPLKNGDIVNIDISTVLNGYFSDASRTFIIGEVSENTNKLVQVTKEALYLAINGVKPYDSVNVIGEIIEEYAVKHGFSVVQDYCGHGIGLKFHEEPQVIHYKSKTKGMILVPGMVFTIEPMLCEGSAQCITLPGQWPAITKDKSNSAQWEHTVVVTESGLEILA